MNKIHKLYYLLGLLLISCLFACSDEGSELPPDMPEEAELCTVEIRIGAEGVERTRTEMEPSPGELIHSLIVLVVNEEGTLEAKWELDTDGSSYTGNPDDGNVSEWRSGEIELPAGMKTIYAFANMEKIKTTDGRNMTDILNIAEDAQVSLSGIVLDNPADDIDLEEKFIPMSVKREIQVSDLTDDITIELVRLVSRVDVQISTDRDAIISSFKMGAFAKNVPLFEEEKNNTFETPLTEVRTLEVQVTQESPHTFSFYVNETMKEAAYGIELVADGTTLTGNTENNTTIPRNSVLPLYLSLSDYQLVLKIQAQVAPIGVYPMDVFVTPYSLTDNYVVESIPEGCTFTISGELRYQNSATPMTGWTWKWETDENEDLIVIDNNATTVHPLSAHVSAIPDAASHTLSFTVTYQNEEVKTGTLTIKQIAPLEDGYPIATRSATLRWSDAPGWSIPIPLSRPECNEGHK